MDSTGAEVFFDSTGFFCRNSRHHPAARGASGLSAAGARTLALALVGALAGCSPKKSVPEPVPASSAPPSSAASSAVSASASVATSATSAAPAIAPSAATGAVPPLRGVLLITIDSLRADMPWAGYPRDIAPNLTKLEAASVSYTRAYALSSYTSQSVGGFLAGAYPSTIKRDGFFFGTYPPSVVMFPERLQRASVRTVAAQAHGYFKHGTGLDQGFDTWKLVAGLKWNATTDENVTGVAHEALAEQLLTAAAQDDGRFFAWFHFMDPHDLYKRHREGPDFGATPRDLYDGEVFATDAQIGKLLAFLERQPYGAQTAVVVSADHGESFGAHGVYRHGLELWEDLVHVPFFVRLPGVSPRRIDTPRSHLDLAPTVLALLGAPPAPELRGVSLVEEIRGAAPPEPRDVVVDLARTSDNDRRRGLIRGKDKLLAFGDDASWKLFDLANDPAEKQDLSRKEPGKFKELRDAYRALKLPEEKPTVCRKLKGAPEGRDY
jgi:choline-sulfatase